jgi:hypothetical protein
MSNSINTTVHTGTFTKADGSKRTMRFVRWGDIPSSFKGNPSDLNVKKGSLETVYDVEAKGYRSFNNGTMVGSISTMKESVTFG